mmetsp:Transcript_23709/g.49231  ORF Transcript_23709/g.49231 Transcript_23709/m.49231 type:complete len:87 (-) Transcript_23709:46-306(-)
MLSAAAPRLAGAAARSSRAAFRIPNRTFMEGGRNTDGSNIDRSPWIRGIWYSFIIWAVAYPTVYTHRSTEAIPPPEEVRWLEHSAK